MKMTGPVKYLNVLHHNRTQFRHFFLNILQKYNVLIYSIKNDNVNLQKLWCLSACKKWTEFLTSFLRYCKDIANLSFWVLWECLIMPINNDSITLYETLMYKVLESTWRKLWCLPVCKKSTPSLTSNWDIVKTLQTCYFGNYAWPSPSNSLY